MRDTGALQMHRNFTNCGPGLILMKALEAIFGHVASVTSWFTGPSAGKLQEVPQPASSGRKNMMNVQSAIHMIRARRLALRAFQNWNTRLVASKAPGNIQAYSPLPHPCIPQHTRTVASR